MKKRVFTASFLMALSIGFVLFFSKYTSPLFLDAAYGNDSDIFMLAGKLWKEGVVLYKQFFDHKGPLIFFIDYVGQLIKNGKMGIFLIQICFMFFTLWGTYKLAGYFYKAAGSMVVTILFLIFLLQYYEGGNLTEEYCLPFLIWSFYFAVGYLLKKDDGQTLHKPIYALFYGITFMVCTLTRVTNALPLCVVILFGFIVLIQKRQWKLIGKNILAFFIGAGCLLIPFVIYFASKDALYDMFYGTILYNIGYTTDASFIESVMRICKYPTWFLPWFLPFIFSFAVGSLVLLSQKKNRYIALLVIISSVSGCFFMLNSNFTCKYFQAYLPILVLAMGLVPLLLKSKKIYRILMTIIIMGISIVMIRITQIVISDRCSLLHDKSAMIYREKSADIVAHIPIEDRDKVLAYDLDAGAYFYISTDIHPCFKYCLHQVWQSSHSKEMRKELLDFLKSGEGKYIVVSLDEADVEYIFDEKYDEVYSNSEFRLLRINE